MLNINATSLRRDMFNILSKTIKYNEVINVNTKEGNAVILSEEEYNGMLATMQLSSDPELKKKILDGKKEEINDCVGIDEVSW